MPRRLALIIGNHLYQDPHLAQLVAPGADARLLARVLLDEAVGAFDDARVLLNEPVQTLRKEIASLLRRRRSDDLLLLYFSGHGVLDDDGRLFLAAADTEHDLLDATAIPADYLTDLMNRSRSRRQVLILDCCHSGAFARGGKGAAHGVGRNVGIGSAFEGNGYGRVVLTASTATQYAWEGAQLYGDGARSVFTYHLTRGLQTGAADLNGDGLVDVDELYEYVYEQVGRAGANQTPSKWSYRQEGELIIARNPYPVVVGPAEQTYRFTAGRYGIGYEALEIDCHIARDGSARIRRIVQLEAYTELARLDTYLLLPESAVGGGDRSLAVDLVQSHSPDHIVTLGNIKDEGGRLSAVLSFAPPLLEGQSLRYEMAEQATGALFAIGLDREQLAQRAVYYDYLGWNINRPTRHLTLRAHFPAGAAPDNYGAEVRFASASGFPADNLNLAEQKRLSRPTAVVDDNGRQTITLNVDYPAIGLIYVLRWQPREGE